MTQALTEQPFVYQRESYLGFTGTRCAHRGTCRIPYPSRMTENSSSRDHPDLRRVLENFELEGITIALTPRRSRGK